jgi:hypothetical protein
MRSTSVRPLLATLFLVLAACGGVPGAPAAPAAVFPVGTAADYAGDYQLSMLVATTNPADTATSYWGVVTADGTSTLAGSYFRNIDGVVSGPHPFPALSYAVDAEGRLSWAAPGGDIARGGLSHDGSIGALAIVPPIDNPGIALTGRQEGTYDMTSLNGVYHVAGFIYNHAATAHATYWGTFSFDGAGNAVVTLDHNIDGTPGLTAIGATYAVLPDGTTVVTFPGAFHLRGAILAGGDVLSIAGGLSAGRPPSLFVMAKSGAGQDTADAAGAWHLVGLEYDLGGAVYRSRNGRLVANAAGQATLSMEENVQGVLVPGVADLATITVLGNGETTVATGAGATWQGGLSAHGTTAVLGGETAGGNPLLYVLIR